MSDELKRLLKEVQTQLEKEGLNQIIVDFDEWWCPTASNCLSSLLELAEEPTRLKEATERYHEEKRRNYEERRRILG